MKRTKLLGLALGVALLPACSKHSMAPSSSSTGQVAANWSSTAPYASWANGGYTIYNDVWGSGAGPQTIWANSYSNWGVWSEQPNTGGVKSFANSTRPVGVALSSLTSCTSSFNVTPPGSGSYESTYDIWDSNNAYEIMLWMNWTGSVGPISSSYNSSGQPVAALTNVNVGGHTWNVYKGSNGSNAVFSFLCTSQTNSGTVDIRAILNWIKSEGWFGSITLGKVQFGFEITSSPAGLNFDCNSYSVSYAG
jgi:hypothetical protein